MDGISIIRIEWSLKAFSQIKTSIRDLYIIWRLRSKGSTVFDVV